MVFTRLGNHFRSFSRLTLDSFGVSFVEGSVSAVWFDVAAPVATATSAVATDSDGVFTGFEAATGGVDGALGRAVVSGAS